MKARTSRIRRPGYNCLMHVCLFDIDGTLLSSGGAGNAVKNLDADGKIRGVNHARAA